MFGQEVVVEKLEGVGSHFLGLGRERREEGREYSEVKVEKVRV